MKGLIIAFSLAILCFLFAPNPQNFQKRRLYYNQEDNVCLNGRQSDQVNLVVTFNDRNTLKKTISGGTYCSQWSTEYSYKLIAAEALCYTECFHEPYEPDFYCDQICFNQEPKYFRLYDVLMGIVNSVTARNPAIFDKQSYNCVVEGDGTIPHFGPFGPIPIPRMDVHCERVASNPEKQLKKEE